MRFVICGLSAFLLMGLAGPVARDVAAQSMNACGCYRDDKGICKCTKKSKCGCPEECEPVGCDEKRQKEADRAANVALKQMESKERKRAAEAARKSKAEADKTGKTQKKALDRSRKTKE